MRKAFLLAPLLALLALPAGAQDVPKIELYGGYSYMQITSAGAGNHLSSSGWEVAANWNLNHWLGLTADFDGNYCCSGQYLYSYMGGAQFSARKEKRTLFLHALVGYANAKGLTDTGGDLAWALGVGADWNVKPGLAIRLPQIDWFRTSFLNGTQNDWRLSAGVVWHFGKR